MVGTNDDVLKTIAEVANTLPRRDRFCGRALADRLVIEAVDTVYIGGGNSVSTPSTGATRLSNTSSREHHFG